MSQFQKLLDKRRAAEAVLYGVHMEIALALGEKADAEHYKSLMYAAIKSRKADVEAGCYFMEQGDKDRVEMLARKAVAG